MLTDICDRLDMDVPIFAFSHCRDVVAAVTNSGGIGVLGATTLSPAALETDLIWIDNETKGRPYGVDLLLPTTFARPLADDGGAASAASFPAEHQDLRRPASGALPGSRAAGARSRSERVHQRVT